jgi:hypothetical protein
MAEKDLTEELEERLGDRPLPGDETDDATPEEPQDEPDLEDESTDDEDKPDDEEPGPDEPDEPVRETRSRARDRIQNLQRDRDAAAARAEAAEARAAAAEARQNADAAAAEEQREQQILASLDDAGRTQYLMAKEIKATKDGQQQILRRLDDQSDKADFAVKAAKDPRRAKLMDQVERVMRNSPPGVKRDHVFWTLLGKATDEGAADAGARQRKAAAGRVAAQRTGGARARSNTGGAPRRGGDIAARMERDDPAI